MHGNCRRGPGPVPALRPCRNRTAWTAGRTVRGLWDLMETWAPALSPASSLGFRRFRPPPGGCLLLPCACAPSPVRLRLSSPPLCCRSVLSAPLSACSLPSNVLLVHFCVIHLSSPPLGGGVCLHTLSARGPASQGNFRNSGQKRLNLRRRNVEAFWSALLVQPSLASPPHCLLEWGSVRARVCMSVCAAWMPLVPGFCCSKGSQECPCDFQPSEGLAHAHYQYRPPDAH